MTFELGINYSLIVGLAGKGRAPLMQEFGPCTAPQDSDGVTITDDFLGQHRTQHLAAEAEGATYHESMLDVSADEYYRAPDEHFERLYRTWTSEHP